MKSFFLLFCCFCSFFVLAQKKQKAHHNYEVVDTKIDKMPVAYAQSMEAVSNYIKDNFATEPDRIRAVFYWTAKTISYDVDNMFEVKFEEKLQERVERAFENKKGVCFDYANIFSQLANAVGIKSIVISGYTKWNKIKIDNLSHAWNAARIDNKWYLFDPTWGSGYVLNGVFTRRIDDKNFMVDPEIMINTHMPFDYLWQFRNYPISNQEFMDGVYLGDDQKQKFDYVKELERFESLSKLERLYEVAQRIEKGGMKNQHIAQAYIHAKTAWKNENEREKGKQYTEIVNRFNRANRQLNDFINYRNKHFQPLVSDDEIKRKIEEPRENLVKCQESLLDFEKDANTLNKNNIDNLKEAIAKRLEKTEEYLQFVNTYLSKPVTTRKMMFYKVTTKTR